MDEADRERSLAGRAHKRRRHIEVNYKFLLRLTTQDRTQIRVYRLYIVRGRLEYVEHRLKDSHRSSIGHDGVSHAVYAFKQTDALQGLEREYVALVANTTACFCLWHIQLHSMRLIGDTHRECHNKTILADFDGIKR